MVIVFSSNVFIFALYICSVYWSLFSCLLNVSMPPKQLAFCNSCQVKHPRPVGQNCKRPKNNTASVHALSVQGPPVVQNLNAHHAVNVPLHATPDQTPSNPQSAMLVLLMFCLLSQCNVPLSSTSSATSPSLASAPTPATAVSVSATGGAYATAATPNPPSCPQ